MTTHNDIRPTNDELDPGDLLESMTIDKVQPRAGVGGRWIRGTMEGHRFDALVFPEHATNPEYELDDSRISKLWVRRNADRATVANFDRGWDIRPTTPVAQKIVDLLTAGLAELIFNQ